MSGVVVTLHSTLYYFINRLGKTDFSTKCRQKHNTEGRIPSEYAVINQTYKKCYLNFL